jgi:diamine N-acetyltransferase
VTDETDYVPGKVVKLRPSTPADRRDVWLWGDGSDISHWTNPPPMAPSSFEVFCEDWKPHYFDGSEPQRGRVFIIEVDGRAVGMIAYNHIDESHQRVEIDIWMSCEANCGRGYGSDALDLLNGYLRKTFKLKETWAQPSARNPRSIRAFAKAGFVKSSQPIEDYGRPDCEDAVLLVRQLQQT